MDEGNAENCNYGSNDSGDTDNDDTGDGDSSDGDSSDSNSSDGDSSNGDSSDSNSSDSNEGNKAHGCAGQRESPAPVSGKLKLKRAAKHRLQRSHLSPLVLSIHTSNQSTALSSNYYKRARSPIYNRLYTQKPLSNLASNSNSSKAILKAVLNTNSEEWLI